MKYLCLILLFSFFGCYTTTRNCNDFKTGAFYSEVTIDLQIEIYNNKIDSSKLRWINDCEVVFKTIHPKNMAERKDIHLKILTTTDSSYTYEYSYVGETKKQKGVAFKIK